MNKFCKAWSCFLACYNRNEILEVHTIIFVFKFKIFGEMLDYNLN